MLGNCKNIFRVLLVTALVVSIIASMGTVAASSHTGDGEMEAQGELRVVHASPDAPNVDVYVDGDAVLEDVAFGTVSGYLELPSGTYQIEVTAAGDPDTSVFNQEVEVGEGDYTALAIGELAEGSETPFTVEVLEDDNSPTNEGEARVRAVHASPDAPNVDITVESTGDALFENVSVGDSGYVSVPEGEYTIEIRVAQDDNEGDIVTTFDLNAEAGNVYSAFAVGYAAPDEAPGDQPFEIVTALDAEPGEGEPTATVTFEDQTIDDNTVVVSSASLPEGGFITMHDDSLLDGDALGSVVGTSEYLESGGNEIEVELDEELGEGEHTLIAMPHFDTNGNEEYDFVETEGGEDGPYTDDEGPVTNQATITVEGESMDDGMEDGMEDDGTEDDGMDGGMEDDGMDGNETEDGDGQEDGTEQDGGDGGGEGLPGFTAVAAIVAVIGAALMLARRNDE